MSIRNRFERVLKDKFRFNQASLKLTDSGINELIEMTKELVQIDPTFKDSPEIKVFTNSKPEQLREIAAGGIITAIAMSDFTAIKNQTDTITEFITSGGELELTLNAKTPLDISELESLEGSNQNQNELFKEYFDFNFKHTP